MLIPKQLEEFKLSLGGLWHPDGGEASVHPRVLGEALLEHRDTLRVLELDLEGGLAVEEFTPLYHDEDTDPYELEAQLELVGEYFRLEEAVSVRGEGAGRGGTWGFGSTVGLLRGYTALRELGVSVRALLGLAKGSQDHVYGPAPRGKGPGMRLVDMLPEGLEVLRLFEYEKGRWPDHDEQVRELMESRGERFPGLTVVEGVEESLFMRSKDLWDSDEEDGYYGW